MYNDQGCSFECGYQSASWNNTDIDSNQLNADYIYVQTRNMSSEWANLVTRVLFCCCAAVLFAAGTINCKQPSSACLMNRWWQPQQCCSLFNANACNDGLPVDQSQHRLKTGRIDMR